MLFDLETLTIITLVLCFTIILSILVLCCHIGEFLENHKLRENRTGIHQISRFMIKEEVTPQRKTLQKSYEINQQIQKNHVLTDKSRTLKRLHRLPNCTELYQISGPPSGTQGPSPRNSVLTAASPSSPVFVQPKILLSANAWITTLLSANTKYFPNCQIIADDSVAPDWYWTCRVIKILTQW